MLLVFSHFAVSRPLLTNLPSFPLGQTAFSTPWVPVGLGSFLGWVPSHLLQPAKAGALPRQPAGREPRCRQRWDVDVGAPWGRLGPVFLMILGIQSLTQFL